VFYIDGYGQRKITGLNEMVKMRKYFDCPKPVKTVCLKIKK